MLRRFTSRVALILLLVPVLPGQEAPKAAVTEAAFRFAPVLAGEIIEHTFTLRNQGAAPLTLKRADMTPPLRATQLASVIPPGGEAALTFRLDTGRLGGLYEGEIILDTDDPARPEIHLTFRGQVTPRIEFLPQPMFFVSTVRGEAKTASIEIINHQEEPLEILAVQNPSTRFTTELETLEAGRRYRLTLQLPGDGIAGRRNEPITLRTNSTRYPQLRIAANTLVKERVYTAPETVDFGTIPAAALAGNSRWQAMLHQKLMIYQVGGTDFQVKAHSDLPYVELGAEPSAEQAQYELRVSLIPERLPQGRLQGTIIISTNDPEFPVLEIPVTAYIENKP